MIICACCKERKHSDKFKIKTKLVNKEVLFKVCNDCGTEERLEDIEWRDKMIDEGAISYERGENRKSVYDPYIKKYKITTSDYDRMYKEQKGRCKICNTHQIDLDSILCVDHDHKTGDVRALLCNLCNSALGMIKENEESVRNMLLYIKYHKK